jgi:hypothetical protein
MKSVSKACNNLVCCFLITVLILLIPLNASGAENIRPQPLDITGTLVIHIQDAAGKGLYSNLKAYKAGTREMVRTYNSSQAYLKLPPGIYDLEIYYLELMQSKWLRNVSVKAGDNIEKIVRFQFGQVEVNVLGPDGKGLYSTVTAYKAGTTEMVRTHSSSQAFLKLPLGTYDIKVYSMTLQQEKWMRGISVTDGGKIQRTTQFSEGQDSRIGAQQNAGSTDEDRIIKTDTLQMTGLSAEERIIRTDTLQMTGFSAEERIIRTDTLQMTGMGSE